MHKVLGKNSWLPGSSYDVSVHGVSMNDVGVSMNDVGVSTWHHAIYNAHRPTRTSTKL